MPPQPDQAVTMTAIAMAESGGRDSNVPLVFTRVATHSPQAPSARTAGVYGRSTMHPPTVQMF